MPTSREDKYSAIKKVTCVECPVPSQVSLGLLCQVQAMEVLNAFLDSAGVELKQLFSVHAVFHQSLLYGAVSEATHSRRSRETKLTKLCLPFFSESCGVDVQSS